MAVVTIKELIEAGVHYGTKASMWHPRMEPYIFGKRKDVYIIDLKETAKALINAHYYVKDLGKKNKSILFVGTKRQAKELMRDAATSLGQPFVTERWLGGTLTNNETIRASIRRLEVIEEEMARPDYIRESKKAQARHARERRRILRNLAGVRNMRKLPDAMFVIDPIKETTAIREAKILGIPVIALLDTDCDPGMVNLPIPGNDDGIRSIAAVLKVLVDAYNSGKGEQVQAKPAEEAPAKKADKPAAKAPAKKAGGRRKFDAKEGTGKVED